MRHSTWIPVLVLGLFVFSVNAQPSVTCPAPPPGLVNWWTFDEDGAPSRDRAASPNNGQWKGTPAVEERPGLKPSRALCFKTADLVTVPDHDELDLGAEDFTLAFWIRTKASTTIAEKRVKIDTKTYRGYVLFLHQGRPALQMADGGYDNYIASVKVNDGEWHYVVFSVRRIANGGAIFVDDNPPTTFTPRMGSLANDQPLVIGRFDGCLDELQVYRFTAPDRDAITTRFDCKGSCEPPLPELAESGGAWWRFDEPIGTASRDAFGNEANNLSRYAVACAGVSGTGVRPKQPLPGGHALNYTDDGFNVVFWVHPAASDGMMLDKFGIAKNGWRISLKSGNVRLQLNDVISDGPALEIGEWNLIAANVTTSFVELWVFTPSTPKGTKVEFAPLTGTIVNTAALRVGGGIKQAPLPGCYDELQIGGIVMTDQNVLAIARAATNGTCK